MELINISNINKVFNYITDNNIEARKNIFCKIINYLYSANDLIDISINNNIIIKKKKKITFNNKYIFNIVKYRKYW